MQPPTTAQVESTPVSTTGAPELTADEEMIILETSADADDMKFVIEKILGAIEQDDPATLAKWADFPMPPTDASFDRSELDCTRSACSVETDAGPLVVVMDYTDRGWFGTEIVVPNGDETAGKLRPAPWDGPPIPAPAGLGDLPIWWGRYIASNYDCPLLAPSIDPAEFGTTGPPGQPMTGTAGGGSLIEWPGLDTPSMFVIVHENYVDPAMDAYYEPGVTVVNYPDGSEQRLIGDGRYLIQLAGTDCAYEFTSPDTQIYSRKFATSLRKIQVPDITPLPAKPTPTPTPTSPPHCPTAGAEVLRRGDGVSHGCSSVRELQELLTHRYNVAVDGQFGPGTETAVRQFQADHGLIVDGLVGPATWALLVESQIWDY